MGPYCEFCGRRCFVERVLPADSKHRPGQTILMATCVRGVLRDLEATGYSHETATNPHNSRLDDATANLERLEADDIAASLERQDRFFRENPPVPASADEEDDEDPVATYGPRRRERAERMARDIERDAAYIAQEVRLGSLDEVLRFARVAAKDVADLIALTERARERKPS